MHISPDKNPRRRATEISAKRTGEVLTSEYPELAADLFTLKPEGVTFYQMQPLVKVLPQASGHTVLEWADPMVAHLKIDKPRVVARFEAAAADNEGAAGLRARIAQTQWRP